MNAMETKCFNFQIKKVETTEQDDERVLRGWATRPEFDRVGDLVMPEGAVFKLPLPFLLDHDTEKCVGEVEEAVVHADGIEFTARIKKIEGTSAVARQCDNAWLMIKNGLRRFVSIGFRTMESLYNEATDGLIVTRWEWLELSAVTIPALASAEITSAKSLLRKDAAEPVKLLPPESRSKKHHSDSVFLSPKE